MVTTTNTYQDLALQEWLDLGRRSGAIRDARTAALAQRMDEREALAWIADIVTGRASEELALVFMERAVSHRQYDPPLI